MAKKHKPAVSRVAMDTVLRRNLITPGAAGTYVICESDPNRMALVLYTDIPNAVFSPIFDTAIDSPKMFGFSLPPDASLTGGVLFLNLGDHGPLVQAEWRVQVAVAGYIVAYTVIDSCNASPTASA